MNRFQLAFASAAVAACLTGAAAAQAQEAQPTPLAEATALHAPAGAPIIVELAEPVGSTTHKQGDLFAIRLASPVTVDGKVVIPAGAMGKGEVIDAAHSGALGRPAKLVLAGRYIEVDGAKLTIRGFHLGSAGKDATSTILAANFVPYVGILADFMHGGEITIPAGTLGQAKLAAEYPAAPSAAPATPAPAATVESAKPSE